MRSLPAAFTNRCLVQPNTPAFIVKLMRGNVSAVHTYQVDWEEAKASSGLDLDTTPGDVMLSFTENAGILQDSTDSLLTLGYVNYTHDTSVYHGAQVITSPVLPGWSSFAWQSFKNTLGYTATIERIGVWLYATGAVSSVLHASFLNEFKVRIYDAKNGTPLSTQKTFGGSGCVVDEMVYFDFTDEAITIADDAVYWIWVYGKAQVTILAHAPIFMPTGTATCGVRYDSSTSAYGFGQMDAKPYDNTETVNIGDAGFSVSYLPGYVPSAYFAHYLDILQMPIESGEWRIDVATPLDSRAKITAWAVQNLEKYARATASVPASIDDYRWVSMAYNGSRLVAVGDYGSETKFRYFAYSDDYGATWTLNTSDTGANPGCIIHTSSHFVVTPAVGTFGDQTVWRSSDGEDWDAFASAMPSVGQWYMAHNGSGRILAVDISNTNVMATSDDNGETWTSRSGGSYQWGKPIWTGTAFFMTASGDTNKAQSSTDGITWTPRTMPYSRNWEPETSAPGYACINGLIVAYGYHSGDELEYPHYISRSSDDGATWSSVQVSAGFFGRNIMTNGLHFFSDASTRTVKSSDGITWDIVGSHGSGETLLQYAYCGWRVLGYSYEANKFITISHDGIASLGEVEDGDAITTLAQYYLYEAYLVPDSSFERTPTVRSVTAMFPDFLSFATHAGFGYEPMVIDVSALQSKISDFDATTVGQISIRLGLNRNLSSWMRVNNPRNREARISMGFSGDGYGESDFIDYYRGYVEDWSIDGKDTVALKLRDFSKQWKGCQVPAKWQGISDDLSWTSDHPVDIMLDILTGYIAVPPKTLNRSSFEIAKGSVFWFRVTRTITEKTQDAQELLEQLRKLLCGYFIPSSDGRTKLKLWSPDEAASLDLTDDDLMDVSYAGNSASLCNQVNVYFHIDKDGKGRGGDGFGYLVNNIAGPYAIGTVTIACDTGTGTILVGDVVSFDGDPNYYRVTVELSGGSFTIESPGLIQTLADNTPINVFGTGLVVVVDSDSQAAWGEIKAVTIKDYWTIAGKDHQVSWMASRLIARYKDIPDIISFGLDMRHVGLEVGDMVNITTRRAPSEDLEGIGSVKYQVVGIDLDWKKHRLNIKALNAHVDAEYDSRMADIIGYPMMYGPLPMPGLPMSEQDRKSVAGLYYV